MTSSTNNESSFNNFYYKFAKHLGTLTVGLYAAKETGFLTYTPGRLTLISALGLATLPTIINTTPTIINKTCEKAQQAWSWCKKNPKQAIAIATTITAMGAAGVGYYFYPEKCRQIFEKAKQNFNRFNPNSAPTSPSTTGTATQAVTQAAAPVTTMIKAATENVHTTAELVQVQPMLNEAAQKAAEQALDEVTREAAAFVGTAAVLDTAAELVQVPILTEAAQKAAEQALDEVTREAAAFVGTTAVLDETAKQVDLQTLLTEAANNAAQQAIDKAANPIATMMEQAATVQVDPPQYDPNSELHDIEIPENVIDAMKEFGSIIQQLSIAGLYDLQETALQTCLKTQELGERIVAELGESIQEALLQTPIF